jgi:small neutral amino acid transporter SnatA (MarC family)
MTLGYIDIWQLVDILVLLLIGMGPKVAVALVLVVLGAFLMRLLHLSPEAMYIAGGIVFLLVALKMLAEAGGEEEHHVEASGGEAIKMAHYPLAVTEAVFGILLAALAAQLMLQGLADLDVIAQVGH